MAGSIEELLDILYTEIEEAKSAPFSSDKCQVERDKILDMIDDVRAELPVELKRARDLLANKNDYIAAAKREAEGMKKQAEDYARRIINEDTLTRQAQERAETMLAKAEDDCTHLKNSVNEYCEDTLRRVEEAVADAYDSVKVTRSKFRSMLDNVGAEERSQRSQRRAMYDAEADEE